jgi:1-acyl-sn-glycerol-3-phosphate acyltransferase
MECCAALARKALWRVVLTVTGGLRVRGVTRLPDGPCVIVANHNSHADTAALIAALPARRRPAVAAAADYWFDGTPGGLRALLSGTGLRPWACQALCGAFPVRRGGGGTTDLEAAARLLAAGRDVVIYPEGSRSRDGSIGEFRHGAARLAVLSGVPIVPVAITGTRELLPASRTGARRRRGAVTVRVGVPVHAGIAAATAGPAAVVPPAGAGGERDAVSGMTAAARVQVVMLAAGHGEERQGEGRPGRAAGQSGPALADSPWRVRVERFAVAWYGALLVAAWAFGEALSWPLLPELILAVVCVGAPRAGIRLSLGAAIGSVVGGAAGYLIAAHGIILPEPVTTARMHAAVAAQVTAHGAAAVLAQPLSGIPFKVYVATSGARHVGFGRFLLDSAQARGARILASGLIMTGIGACLRRWRRFYPAYLLLVAAVYLGGWSAVVAAWS